MDKYQEYLLKKLGFIMCSTKELDDIPQAIRSKNNCVELKKDKGVLILKQYADITITNYALILGKQVVECLGRLLVSKNEAWEEFLPVGIDAKHSFGSTFGFDNPQAYIIPIDFDKKEMNKIKMVFRNNLADDYTLELRYKEADKQAYYAQKEQERNDTLLASAAIKCSTGTDLVNIYFQPCNDDYARTEIILYRDEQMLAKYKVDEECFFKAITGLAYGTYKFILKQYDKDNNIILESDPTSFKIESATAHIYGKGFVCN
ncbi:MAG: hypothetical protein J6B09_07445 [Clostridia bacterium]|nr:hypothetical protein [Clostridia bacterium]